MTEQSPLKILLECLRDHDIPFDKDELQRALQSDSGPLIEEWINENLRDDTILTKEELQL